MTGVQTCALPIWAIGKNVVVKNFYVFRHSALYWKGITKLGAIAGILSGTFVSLFWMVFVFAKTATGLGICKFIFGVNTLLSVAPWPYIDVMLIAVPISTIFVIVVSLLTKPPAQEVIDNAFKDINKRGSDA